MSSPNLALYLIPMHNPLFFSIGSSVRIRYHHGWLCAYLIIYFIPPPPPSCSPTSLQMSCAESCHQSRLNTALLAWRPTSQRGHLRERWTTCPSPLLCMGRASCDGSLCVPKTLTQLLIVLAKLFAFVIFTILYNAVLYVVD